MRGGYVMYRFDPTEASGSGPSRTLIVTRGRRSRGHFVRDQTGFGSLTARQTLPAEACGDGARLSLKPRRSRSYRSLRSIARRLRVTGLSLLGVALRRLTDFEQVLLGLVCESPSTGYELKHEFATTPLGVYQPSSGAIYPALRRLELRGLLRVQRGTQGDAGRARRRVIYHITEQGRAAHAAWVRQPVNPATIARDMPLHLMRFVMMEQLLPRAEVIEFLADLRDALAAFLDGLEAYAAASGFDGGHPALAVDHGISLHLASLAWTKRTINVLAGQAPRVSPDWERPSRRAATSRPAAPSR